ncbi:hypothetical protein C8Q73DRAFT_674482 [Cubamyces lactineus]|nr:hypothetical protein C8Q73DRAFT_674482 [Cubamyces lactineus]
MAHSENVEQKAATPLGITEDIRQHLGFLCHDLRTFTSNRAAAERLNTSVHLHFIGPPYLTEQDAQTALSSTLQTLRNADGDRGAHVPNSDAGAAGSLTLSAFLEEKIAQVIAAREAKRSADNGKARDFVLCTSHDLAPILLEACAFPKEYFETRAFKDAYKRWEAGLRKAKKKGKARA